MKADKEKFKMQTDHLTKGIIKNTLVELSQYNLLKIRVVL